MKKAFFIALALLGNVYCFQRELQFENEFVRVWKAIIPPNEPLNYHRHDTGWVVFTIKGGYLKRIEDTGEISYQHFEVGKASWIEPDPVGTLHAEVNEGCEPLVLLVSEVKSFNAPGLGYGIDFDFTRYDE